MSSLLVKVKARMAIYAHEKVRGLLEGEYDSVFKGRSMDFDDLREYIPGDDIKDIDWKATARSGQTLIKRYIAVRKHNILLVADTGRDMTALSQSGEIKRDVGVIAAGVIGYVAQKHGDLVALVAGDDAGSTYMPLKGDNAHLERILQHINEQTSPASAASNLSRQLEYIARSIRRKMMLVIVTDDVTIDDALERQLRRLRVQHEIIWLTIADANATDSEWRDDSVYDVTDGLAIPPFLRLDKTIQREYAAQADGQRTDRERRLARLRVSSERISGEKDVVYGIMKLLEKQRYVRR